MNIFIDVTACARPDLTGIGVYTQQLVSGIAAQNEHNLSIGYRLSRWKRRAYLHKHFGSSLALLPIFPLPSPLPFWKGNNEKGVFHGPEFRLPFGKHRFKKIVTVHDLMGFQTNFGVQEEMAFARENFKKMLYKSAPDAILTVSKAVAEEFKASFPSFADRTFYIHSGINHLSTSDSLASWEERKENPYIFYLGTLEERKNLVRLLETFALLAPDFPSLRLKIAGGAGSGVAQIKQAWEQHPFKNRIDLLGYIDNATRLELYTKALLFVYPSVYEGFGLPILEAMQLGTLVACSNIGAMKEIAADAAVLFSPFELMDMREKIAACLNFSSSEFSFKTAQAKQHAASFTWEACVKETVNLYKILTE